MSFGPKLEQTAVVGPGEEIVVTLAGVPSSEEFEQEAEIFAEEPGGVTTLTIKAVGLPGPRRGKP